MTATGVARSAVLNEQELWREMVRWSGGLVHEQDGRCSSLGRAAICASRSGWTPVSTAPRRCVAPGSSSMHRRVVTSCSSANPTTRTSLAPRWPPGTPRRGPSGRWRSTSRPTRRRRPGTSTCASCRRRSRSLDYGTVVAEANDDPGERERAGLLFHDRTILAPHIAAFVAYLDGAPVVVRDDARQPRRGRRLLRRDGRAARRRGLGDALTRMAARAGFELGARAAWLGASEMGADLYRRIGFSDLGTTIVEYESPATGTTI